MTFAKIRYYNVFMAITDKIAWKCAHLCASSFMSRDQRQPREKQANNNLCCLIFWSYIYIYIYIYIYNKIWKRNIHYFIARIYLSDYVCFLFQPLVCKSDQLIKRRAKSGLITVNSSWNEVRDFVKKFINKEFTVCNVHTYYPY